MTARSAFDRATERFLAYLRDQKHVSDQTLRAYASDLAQFGGWLAEEHTEDAVPGPEGIDALAVRGFVASLHRAGLRRSSTARKLSAVPSFLEHAVREGDIGSNPGASIPTPKLPRLLPKNLSVDEVFRLLDAVGGDDPTEVPVGEGKHLVEGDYEIDGVPGTGAKINLTFFEPGGAITDKLLPTGHVKNNLKTEEYGTFTVSIVDASNAVVFVRAKDLGLKGTEINLNSNPEILRKLEAIRSQAAALMGVAPSPKEARPNLPFIALVSASSESQTLAHHVIPSVKIDLVGRMLSMGKLHGAYPVTGAISIAGASKIEGTVVSELMAEESQSREEVRIGHPGGNHFGQSDHRKKA